MGILDSPFDEPFQQVPNLLVSFPNRDNWLQLDSARGRKYEDRRDAHRHTVTPEIGKKLAFKVRIFPFEFDPDIVEDTRNGAAAVTMPVDRAGAAYQKKEVDITPPKGPGQPDKMTETTYSQGKGSDVNVFFSTEK